MRRPRLRIRSKIWLEADGRLIFSDGRLRLLRGVERLGSLRRAAQALGMSYRAAWGLLKVTERALGLRLLDVTIGGRHGGGARLTPAARDLLARFERVKRRVDATADRAFLAGFAPFVAAGFARAGSPPPEPAARGRRASDAGGAGRTGGAGAARAARVRRARGDRRGARRAARP